MTEPPKKLLLTFKVDFTSKVNKNNHFTTFTKVQSKYLIHFVKFVSLIWTRLTWLNFVMVVRY